MRRKIDAINGRKAINYLRSRAYDGRVRLEDAFLLAGLHPSNISRWSRQIHSARVRHIRDVEAAIELLSEDTGRSA